MNFNDAMSVVRTGGKVSREAWGASSPETLYLKTFSGIVTMLLSGTSTLDFGTYRPSVDDISAVDWILTTAI